MSDLNLVWRTDSAYDYPLLVKNMLAAPLVDDPDQEIVYRGEKRFTYRQFRERVGRLAAALIELGVKPGDTVAMMDWDSHRYLECFYAVPMIGAVLHTVNVRLAAEQLVYTIGHAEDDVVLINAEFLPLIEQIKGRIETVRDYILINDEEGKPDTSLEFAGEYESLLAAAEPMTEFPDLDENTRAWLTQGYFKDHANSERLWEGGWMHTQDIAAWGARGSVRITDRAKDIVKIGGEWLSSLEIEDILVMHPAVAEVAVIGQPDEKWSEVPLGLVVLKEGVSVSEKELRAHVKSFIDAGVLPREAMLTEIRFIDAVDRTSVGKVNKVALRAKHLG